MNGLYIGLVVLMTLVGGCTTTRTVMKEKTTKHEKVVPLRAQVIAKTGPIATPTAAQHGSMADLMESILLKGSVFDVRAHGTMPAGSGVAASLKTSDAGSAHEPPTVYFRGHLTDLPQTSVVREGVLVKASPKSLFTVHAFREDGKFLASQKLTGQWPGVVLDGMLEILKSKKLEKQEERYKYTTSKMVPVKEEVPNPGGTYLIAGGLAVVLGLLIVPTL